LKKILFAYYQLERPIVYLIIADFFVQLINTSFFLLLNFYMHERGYSDADMGGFTSWRFMAVFLLAFPFGFFIKGKKLKPFFLIAAVGCPLASLAVLYGVEHQIDILIKISLACWGASFMCLQTTTLPYIFLNAKQETHSEAIAFYSVSWAACMLIVGLTFPVLHHWFPEAVDNRSMLYACSLAGFVAVIFILMIRVKEKVSQTFSKLNPFTSDDFMQLVKVMTPTVIIAVGAGFTIPMINMFFLYVYDVESKQFTLISDIAYFLVVIGVLIVPALRRKYGYKIAITLVQSLSIIALIIMATTEFYSQWGFAFYVAASAYVLRQPLMNLAQPTTTELMMNYVSKHNRELVSSISASVWAGAWFVSGNLFKILREENLKYGWIFLITAVMYIGGVFWYYKLIEEYDLRKNSGLAEE